jgi:hypothetical protein
VSTPYQLTAIRGGIDRLRLKGAAMQDVLFDALNCRVTEKKTVVPRPGNYRYANLPDGTKGLCSFGGRLHVFAAETLTPPNGFSVHVITHPDAGADVTPINRVYFAAPFMGFLYVVADFVGFSGTYVHFWLQTGDVWQASHTYKHGAIVVPTVDNGFSYQASRIGAPNLTWAPGVQRALAGVVEPTEYNDFFYTVIDVQGTNPRSGDTEPEWPIEDGAQISEDADGLGATGDGTTTDAPDSAETPNPDTSDRYDGGV